MSKLLLIYSSVDGHTKKICEEISKHVNKKYDVDILNLSTESELNIDKYEYIIIGASIRYGNYRRELFEFINQNLNMLDKLNSAFFSVNAVARKPEKDSCETNPYFNKFILKSLWKPKLAEVFAGKIDYPRYKFFDKYIIQFIMWITNGPTDLSKSYDFTDWDKVKRFAEKI